MFHNEVLLRRLQEQLQEDHIATGTGTGDRVRGGSLPEAGSRTPKLRAIDLCTFFKGQALGCFKQQPLSWPLLSESAHGASLPSAPRDGGCQHPILQRGA